MLLSTVSRRPAEFGDRASLPGVWGVGFATGAWSLRSLGFRLPRPGVPSWSLGFRVRRTGVRSWNLGFRFVTAARSSRSSGFRVRRRRAVLAEYRA